MTRWAYRRCPWRLDAVTRRRFLRVNFPLCIYSEFWPGNVSQRWKSFVTQDACDTDTPSPVTVRSRFIVARSSKCVGPASRGRRARAVYSQRWSCASRRSFASKRFSFWRTAFGEMPSSAPSSPALPPFSLDSTSECSSASVSIPLLTQRRRK